MRKRLTSSVAKWMSLAMLPALLAFAPLAIAEGPTEDDNEGVAELEHPEVVPLTVDSREALSNLGSMGVDLAEQVFETEDGFLVEALLTRSEQAELRAAGVQVGEALATQEDFEALQAEFLEMTAEVEAAEEAAEDGDELRLQRAHWFRDAQQGYFLEAEVWSDAGASASTTITVQFNTGPGTPITGQSINLSRYVDAGQYIMHRTNSPILMQGTTPPTRMRATSSAGGVIEVDVTEYLDGDLPTGRGVGPDRIPDYQKSFIDKYLDAQESTARIEQLAAEFPAITEIIELPYQTNGYRRKAMALLQGRTAAVSITAPSSVAGDYAYAAAAYGPAVPAAGTPSAPFAAAVASPSPEWPESDPSFGCGPFVGFPAGAVALVVRGDCTFAEKTLNAQNAGASAVVIVNNVGGAPTAPGGTALPGTAIPTVMMGMAEGNALREATGVVGSLIPAIAGAADSNRVGISSHAWGHEGGNNLTVQAVDPGTPDSPLTITVTGNHIEVRLATNSAGARTSTAAQVVNALNADPAASALVQAYRYRNNAGGGVVLPTGVQRLNDFLSAPDSVSREPATVKMLRIGRDRDGSKTGVFAYSQEHAREWATPLVAVESAARLLHNYKKDIATRRLVNDLDIFIIPVVNPDGTNHSMYDFMTQRRNMTNYCPVTGNYDLNARNTWGVDLNRNFTVGSMFDGFAGASTSCTSDTFAGPAELSEPEARNTKWVADTFDNIKFSMNVHSHGGYFMWAPGAYRQAGRVTLPRPSFGTESFFYSASEHILNRIKEHRGTNIWDTRVGPISDVLYSAAGNSGDELFYANDIFAWSFEVGAARRNAANTGWATIGNGFNPPYAEGYEQAMEFSDGLIGMMEVARIYERDTINPQVYASPLGGTFTGPVEVTFDLSEPADVYYTLDGSTPTLDSPRIEFKGPRQAQQPVVISQSATLRYFAIDAKGNTTGNYNPATQKGPIRGAKFTIR